MEITRILLKPVQGITVARGEYSSFAQMTLLPTPLGPFEDNGDDNLFYLQLFWRCGTFFSLPPLSLQLGEMLMI